MTVLSVGGSTIPQGHRGSEHPRCPAQHLRAFGLRLRMIRRSRHWSVRELSGRSGIATGPLYRIEAGANFTLKVLWRLADGFALHWADLLDDRTSGVPEAPHTPIPFPRQLADFGDRIYGVRTRQRLTQLELARRTGIRPCTLGEIERGAGNIKLDTLFRLAAGLSVHCADLLDDRHTALPRPEPRLPEALERANRLHTELEQLRTQLTLAHARAEVAERVARQAATNRLTQATEQVRLLVDRYDQSRLAALNTQQLTIQLEARRTLYDYLDRICRDAHPSTDPPPEQTILTTQRDLAQFLTTTALHELMRRT